MGYPDYMQESVKLVEQTRPSRMGVAWPQMSLEERTQVLNDFYPSNQPGALKAVRLGASKGDLMMKEFVNILEGCSPVDREHVDLNRIDIDGNEVTLTVLVWNGSDFVGEDSKSYRLADGRWRSASAPAHEAAH